MHTPALKVILSGLLLAAVGFGPNNAGAAPSVSVVTFDGDNGDFTVVSTNNPGSPWSHDAVRGSWICFDTNDCGAVPFRSSRLNSPILTVPTAGTVTLTFDHRYSFEVDTTRWDGGQLRISVNQGAYVAVPLASFSLNGYNNTVGGADVPNCELAGQDAFTAQSPNYEFGEFISSSAVLGTFNANDTLSIQFLGAWDDCAMGAVPNWEIDSVQFSPPLEDRRPRPSFADAGLPADATVVQNRAHTLRSAPLGQTSLQWFKDSAAIPGATGTNYAIASMTPADAGEYFVRAANAIGVTNSRVATLTYSSDTAAPRFVSGVLLRNNTVRLSFDEPLEPSWAQTGFDPFFAVVFVTDPNGDNLLIASGNVIGGTNVVITFQDPPAPDVQYQIGLLDGVVADVSFNPYSTGLPAGVYKVYPLARETVLIAIDATPRWRYNDQNIDFQSRNPSVFSVAFDDSAWPLGAALLGKETSAIPEPIRTPVSNLPLTTYYRTRFNLSSFPIYLSMRTVVDDGARVFLNGTEVFRSPGMTPMPIPLNFGSYAGRTVDNAVYEGPFELPTGSLVVGENVMAVALHQPAATSSDNLWGCELIAALGPSAVPIRITGIATDAANHVILQHNGTGMYVQETSSLAIPVASTVWTTRPGGPHASPHDAGVASGTRFFRLSASP